MRNKIGVIGDRDSVLGFKAVGFDVFEAERAADAAKALHRAASGDYAVIYIMERFAAEIAGDVDRYKDVRYPAVILLPGNSGAAGLGMLNLKKSIERATGSDALFYERT